MGVHGLWELLSPVGVRVSNEHVRGKILAVDVSIWLTQFIKAMRDAEGAQLRNGHLLGVFRRCLKLLFLSVRPVLVFDGATPAIKRRTLASRHAMREKHNAKLRRLAEKLLVNQMRLHAVGTAIEKRAHKNAKQAKGSRNARQMQESTEDNPVLQEGDVEEQYTARQKAGKTQQKRVRWADNQKDGEDKNDYSSDDEDKIKPVYTEKEQTEKQKDGNSERNDANHEEEAFYADDIADEEEALTRDRSAEPIALPQDLDDIDDEAIAGLPPALQSEVFKQFKLQARARHRERMMSKERNPSEFSRTQIEGFLQHTALNRKLKNVRSVINSKSGASQRIASDSGRQYILEERNDVDRINVDAGDDEFESDDDDILAGSSKQESKRRESKGPVDILARLRATRDVTERRFQVKKERQRRLEREDKEMRSGVGWASKVLEGRGGLILGGRSALGVASEPVAQEDSSDSDGSDDIDGVEQFTPSENVELESTKRSSHVEEDDDESIEWEDGNEAPASDDDAPDLDLDMYRKQSDQSGDDASAEKVRERNVSLTRDQEKVDTEGHSMINSTKKVSLLEKNAFSSPIWAQQVLKRHDEDPAKVKLQDRREIDEQATKLKQDHESDEKIFKAPIILKEQDKKYHAKSSAKCLNETKTTPLPSNADDLNERQVAHTSFHKGADIYQESIEGQCGNDEHVANRVDHQELSLSEETDDIMNVKPKENRANLKRGDEEEERALQLALALSLDESTGASELQEEALPKSLNQKSDTTEVVHHNNQVDVETEKADLNSSVNGNSAHGKVVRETDGPVNITSTEDSLVEKATTITEETENLSVDRTDHSDAGTPKTPQKETEPRDFEAEEMTTERMQEIQDELELEALQIQKEKAAQQGAAESVSDEMYSETRDLLKLFGIPYLEAPTEAEAQCAFLDMEGLVDGVITEDSDAFLFGARTVYRHLFSEGQFAEAYDARDINTSLGLNREGLIRLAYLLGSDYTPGVRGVGIVNSVEILEAFPGKDGLEEFRQWTEKVTVLDEEPGEEVMKGTSEDAVRRRFCWKHRNMKRNWEIREGFPNPAVADAYHKPDVDRNKERFKWGSINFGALGRFCWEKFGWEKETFENAVGPLRKKIAEASGPQQRRIDEFFRPHRFAKIKSERLQTAVKGIAGDPSKDLMADVVPKIGKRKRLAISYVPRSDSDEDDALIKAVEKVEEERSRSIDGSSSAEERLDSTPPETEEMPRRSTRKFKRKRYRL